MPRKKRTREEKDAFAFERLQQASRKELLVPTPLRSYREVANYLAAILRAHRVGEVSKDVANTAGYVGGVLLQAIRFANTEEGPASGLSATLQRESLSINMTPEQARSIVMAGSMSTQVQMLKILEEKGQIIDAQVEEKKLEPITPMEKRIAATIERAKELEQDNSFF